MVAWAEKQSDNALSFSKMSKALKPVQEIIAQALAIEAEEAQQAGALGYMARAMVQATMPHKKAASAVHERTNGFYTFTMLARPKVGLPYGSVPIIRELVSECLLSPIPDIRSG